MRRVILLCHFLNCVDSVAIADAVYRIPGSPQPAPAATADPGKAWGLDSAGAEAAWGVAEGEGAVVALIDSGVDVTHAELAGRLWQNDRELAGNGIDDDGNGYIDDIRGWNFVAGTPDIDDDNGHGTFIAGVVVGRTTGIAPKARILILKGLDRNGIITSARAIAALDYAVRAGATVVNASWAGTDPDPALKEAIAAAGRHGVLVVAAAGNDAKNNDADAKPAYPASYRLPNLVSVAAYDSRDELAAFSNYGKVTVALGAPGVAIYGPALNGEYRTAEGTSFAAPFVTGTAALLKGMLPTLSPEALKERILATTEVVGYYAKEVTATAGRVSAANAVRDLRPPRPLLPTSWHEVPAQLETEHPYRPRTVWRETVRYPGARHVRVHFRGFETERGYDRVVLRDGVGRVVAAYSGPLGDFWSADAIGDTLTLELISDHSMQGFGLIVDAISGSDD